MDRIHEIILEQQQHVTALQALTDELRAMFPIGPTPPTATVVTTTAELLAALETGGPIEVAGSGEFFHPTGFVVPSNAAAGVQIMGEDYNSVTPQPTTGVVVRNTSFLVSKATYGGRGILSLIVGGMKSLTFENVSFKGDGNCILQADSEKVQGPCLVQGGTLGYLQYGVMMPGSNYGDPLPPDSPHFDRRLIVTFKDNTFSGAAHSRFKTNFPDNTYA